jgi:UDP-N-acetylmuramate dehydrogenase
MAARGHLIDRLPPVRGRYRADAPLAPKTWLRAGGPAEVLFQPADLDDLAEFLAAVRPDGVPVTVIGVGSNLLVRDGGIEGVVVRLSGPLARVEVEGERVVAGAGVLDRTVAGFAQRAGLAGLEFYVGIPGTVGGAVRMNAGAFGGETAGVVERVVALDERGRRHELGAGEMGFGYRHSALPEGWIAVAAILRGVPADPAAVAARMAAVKAEREATQPMRVATGGSTFKNPPGGSAWRLIDAAGCRGLRRGPVVVSERHCNFLVNTGGATAAEIEALGEEVRARVLAHSGVELEWEIRRIGRPLTGDGGLEAAA